MNDIDEIELQRQVDNRPMTRKHPEDVEKSVIRIIRALGSPNPQVYIRRWPIEDVVEVLTEVKAAVDRGEDIKNPAGMLWRILEERDPGEKRSTNGGNE